MASRLRFLHHQVGYAASGGRLIGLFPFPLLMIQVVVHLGTIVGISGLEVRTTPISNLP